LKGYDQILSCALENIATNGREPKTYHCPETIFIHLWLTAGWGKKQLCPHTFNPQGQCGITHLVLNIEVFQKLLPAVASYISNNVLPVQISGQTLSPKVTSLTFELTHSLHYLLCS